MIVVRAVTCAVAVALLGSPAVAGAPEVEPRPGKRLCVITDERLAEISGIVATEKGYLAVPDGTSSAGRALQVFELNQRCRVSQRHSFARDPFDPEDMAVSRDGTLWIADTGDNALERDTVALWKISADRSTATLHRLKYPDAKRDAEAILVQPDGTPVIITKDLDGGGVAQIFVPTGPPQPKQTVPLKKVGELKYAFTGTGGGPVGGLGQRLVTGAALSADGSRAVVRTYTDAYEYQVSGGNVVSALTKGKPIRTPLPGEPQGEAITYSIDGEYFVTASEASRTGDPPRLYQYVPGKVSPTKDPGATKGGRAGWFGDLRLQDLKMIIAGVGVLGLLMLLIGVFAIRRARREPGDDDPSDDNGNPDDWFDGPGRHPDDPRRMGGQLPDPRDPYGRQQHGHGPWHQPSGGDPVAWDSGRAGGRAAVADARAAGRVPSRSTQGNASAPWQMPTSPAPYPSGAPQGGFGVDAQQSGWGGHSDTSYPRRPSQQRDHW
jgi:hypothetical protein